MVGGRQLPGHRGLVVGRHLPGTFALQITLQSTDAHGGIDSVALWLQPLAVRRSEQAAARIGADVGPLRGELCFVDGHHVAIAGIEKGRRV